MMTKTEILIADCIAREGTREKKVARMLEVAIPDLYCKRPLTNQCNDCHDVILKIENWCNGCRALYEMERIAAEP